MAPLCDMTENDDTAIYDKANELTRLLCEAGKVYRGEKEPSGNLLSWWNEHKEEDSKKEPVYEFGDLVRISIDNSIGVVVESMIEGDISYVTVFLKGSNTRINVLPSFLRHI